MDAGFSFGLPDDEAIAQPPAWTSPIVAILPLSHELAGREVISLSELFAFPVIACHAAYHPDLYQQMEAILRQHPCLRPSPARHAH